MNIIVLNAKRFRKVIFQISVAMKKWPLSVQENLDHMTENGCRKQVSSPQKTLETVSGVDYVPQLFFRLVLSFSLSGLVKMIRTNEAD